MRREVTSHIRQAANAANTNNGATVKEIVTGDIGCLATEVAAIARMCRIPDSEVLHEGEGQARGAYKRKSSCMPDIEVCTAYGPSYMMQKQHRHWHHVGQNYLHTAALVHSNTSIEQQQQLEHAQRQLQQQLLIKAQQGALRPSQAADELLQSFGSSSSNASSGKANSRSSSPGGLPALPRLQPMNSNVSSAGAAPLIGSGSSSEEDRLPGFQAEFDSESAGCTPTYAGDEACLGMLLGTTCR